MRNFYAFLFIGIASLTGISGCNIINPAEVVPTYVHIDSFSFNSRSGYGSSSHKITTVYAYFNNQPVGVFDLPVTFPVIATQAGTLSVLPAIDLDGLTGYELTYPMYLGDTMHLIPNPGNTVNYTPKTVYKDSVKPILIEDFESSFNKFSKLYGDTSLLKTNNPPDVFEGNASGMIRLIPGKDSTTLASTKMSLTPNVNTYAEIDYKGNFPLIVGMSVTLSDNSVYTEYLIALKGQANYKKIYIGLTDFVGNHQGTDYQLLLRAVKPVDVPDGTLLFDNIKVLSF